ncbi:MAG: arsenosugar biosynthesis radical SAM protein ArsS [Planctomycetia bacterium]|nr:arsenosugar biosynthesis radical SAM protein ArsS [Planctomycetia bacterium]
MPGLTLLKQGSPLSDPAVQRAALVPKWGGRTFAQAVAAGGLTPLRATGVSVLQINVGKLCNQTCRHCHVDAGPSRREVMSQETMSECLRFVTRSGIQVVDVTGGAPEMNPNFRWLAGELRRLGCHVIDRSNLTILTSAGFEDLPEFLAAHEVEIVASLPCYLAENTDAQRGDGVFEKSIAALRRLNALGYGQPDGGLVLNLVYNPLGPALPPEQGPLEVAYHRELAARYGVRFNRLYTITNMPISRFLDDLLAHDKLDEYMQLLIDSYNPAAVAGLMCRSTLSVGWDGRLYDCDFNQMLELELVPDCPTRIHDIGEAALRKLAQRPIVVGQHCFGCTAGAGSSCQGAIVAAEQ